MSEQVDRGAARSGVPFNTDMANGERFAQRHGHVVRWHEECKRWIVWSGQHWEVDTSGEVHKRAKETVRSLYQEAADTIDDDQRKGIVNHARKSESQQRKRAMLGDEPRGGN